MENPYFDTTFFQFLLIFFKRCALFLTGSLPLGAFAQDEVQFAVLSSIGASSSLVGCFLVLRKMTMLANSLSHTILLGIVMAFVLGSGAAGFEEGHIDIPLLLFSSFAVACLTALVTEGLTRVARLQEDASTALVFTAFFAVGILLVNALARSVHIGAEAVMGNVDALHTDDLHFALLILFINLFFVIVFYKEWQLTTFDPLFAKSIGIAPGIYYFILMCLVSMTVVGSLRAVGVLMVLTFITAPPLAARLFAKSLSRMLWVSTLISVGASLAAVALSRHLLSVYGLALSTGALLTTLLGTLYLLLAIGAKRRQSHKALAAAKQAE